MSEKSKKISPADPSTVETDEADAEKVASEASKTLKSNAYRRLFAR